MIKILKFLISCIFIFCIVFGFYLYKLHALAVEGNSLFEYRCLHVNPLLISYKNSFLKYANYLNKYPDTTETPEQVLKYLADYISGMKAYVPEETKWLGLQEKLFHRWDFQLFEPPYMKQVSEYQWKMYEGYRDDAKFSLEIVDKPELQEKIRPGDISEARQNRDKYINLYFETFDNASQINDWRKYFGRVPIPAGCTEENVNIPDTSGSINWNKDSKESTPSSIPIDMYPSS